MTVQRQALAGAVCYLLAVLQVQTFDGVAVLSEGSQSWISHRLATPQTESSQKSSTSPRQIFNNCTFNVDLELKEINSLPVGSIERQNIPGFGHLSTPTE
jgi:hypothetical protein